MRKTTIRLSEFFAPRVAPVFALWANRRVRFLAAVLATALVAVTLSACGGGSSGSSAASRGPCDSYLDRSNAAPRGSDEQIRYHGLWSACTQGGVDRAEEIRETGACMLDYLRSARAPAYSDEQIRYNALFDTCVLVDEDMAEEVRQSGTCLLDYRRMVRSPRGSDERVRQANLWLDCLRENLASQPAARAGSDSCDWYYDKWLNAPGGSDEEYLYDALDDACEEAGVNRAEEIRQSSACLSYHRRYWEAPGGSDEEDLYDALWEACLEGGETRAAEVRARLVPY